MAGRLGVVFVVFAFVLSAWASSTDGRPGEFEGMATDAVGCTVVYGDADPIVVGPLRPTEFKIVEPDGSTSFRIARTTSDVIIVVALPNGASTVSYPLKDLPEDGIVASGAFRDGGNLGYRVTCWQGDT